MVKATVRFTYVDKYTGEQHLEGSAVELEESRAAELKALGAVSFAEGPKTEAKKEEKAETKKETTKKASKRATK